jgi:hypothetical protein
MKHIDVRGTGRRLRPVLFCPFGAAQAKKELLATGGSVILVKQ